MKRLKTTGANAGGGGQFCGGEGRGQAETSINGANGRSLAIAVLILVTMLMTIGFAGSAAAVAGDEEFTIVIPIDTVVFASEGSTTVLATTPVGEEFAGYVCSVATRAENQESVHPGNDLIVESGSSLVTLADVEGTAGGVVVGEGELELGSEIVVSLIMGPDAVFSAGFEVHLVCSLAQATTTTIAATTTTTVAATTTTGEVGSTSVVSPPEETPSTVDDSVGGTVITNTTVADEVDDLVVLPFTGSNAGSLVAVATVTLALGGVLVVGARREETE
jgi:hypothetical protein